MPKKPPDTDFALIQSISQPIMELAVGASILQKTQIITAVSGLMAMMAVDLKIPPAIVSEMILESMGHLKAQGITTLPKMLEILSDPKFAHDLRT